MSRNVAVCLCARFNWFRLWTMMPHEPAENSSRMMRTASESGVASFSSEMMSVLPEPVSPARTSP
ncbi:hypothetical protein D3C83_188130 [compost metagenome]